MISLLVGVVLLAGLMPNAVEAESHWETYTYAGYYYQWYCYPYQYTYCQTWIYYGYSYLGSCGCRGCNYYLSTYTTQCSSGTALNCYSTLVWSYSLTGWRCQSGWSGGNCDIPICNIPCQGNTYCSRPNTCECYKNYQGQCQLSYCETSSSNRQRDCYPGTCENPSSNECTCPPGFSGNNCQIITQRAVIDSCTVEVFDTSLNLVAQSRCAAYGVSPETVWINTTEIRRIEVRWNVNYNNPNLPDGSLAPYVKNTPITVKLMQTGYTISSSTVNFVDVSYPNPSQFSAQCFMESEWNKLAQFPISDNATFYVNVSAKLGGQKNLEYTKSWNRIVYSTEFVQDSVLNNGAHSNKFSFDTIPPYHCLSKNSNCKTFPIFLNQSITSDPIIQPTFNEWSDDASGIAKFHAEIYYMKADTNDQLVNIQLLSQADATGDLNSSSINNFRFTCRKPGVYSIELTVYDFAGNSAKARKIILYNDEPVSVNDNSPMYLDKANLTTLDQFGHAYITKLVPPQNGGQYQFTVNWTGHFVDNYQPEWLLPVKTWQDMGIKEGNIDDNFGMKYGTRSVDAVQSLSGIVAFTYAYKVDPVGGGVGLSFPNASEFEALQGKGQTLTLNIDPTLVKNGATIVVWVTAYDITGKSYFVKSTSFIDVDVSKIQINDPSFKTHSSDQYNSSVMVNVISPLSGIKNIYYEIFDKDLQSVITKNTFTPRTLPRANNLPSKRRKRAVGQICDPAKDTTCYCIVSDRSICYANTQEILIDNCWIDKHAGHRLSFTYTLTTLSGLSLVKEIDMGVLNPGDIPCRPTGLSGGAIAGITIAVIIGFIFFVLFLIFCILYFYFPHYSISTRMHNYTQNIHVPSLSKSEPKYEENEIYTSKEVYAQKINEVNSYTPTSTKKGTWSEKKVKNFDRLPDESVHTRSSYVMSNKDVSVGDVLAEGRFAVVSKGFMMKGNEKLPVAVKALRIGYTAHDGDLMRSKILFMKDRVRSHANIVKFLGVMEDENSSEPIMLLEYCDIPLKDWLASIDKVTSDVLENMLNFTWNIAQGVQHLHSLDLIHRRLAVRNVLLKKTLGGLEAKLIGYGPSRDVDEHGASDSQAVVPIKWMAPETLESLGNNSPIYNTKTDAWSFGVTIWEIYSKGAAPYSNHRSAEMKEVLKSGERLECPDECPSDLFNPVVYPCWNSNPKKRSNFASICSAINKFKQAGAEVNGYYSARNNGVGVPGGYYAANSMPGPGYPDAYHDGRSNT